MPRLNAADLEKALRVEIRYDKQRWGSDYQKLTYKERYALYVKLRKRRKRKEREAAKMRAKPELEDTIKISSSGSSLGSGSGSGGPFSHGCGGGRRVIRSPRGLGG